jgi:surfeit locus 1 family protein
MRLTRPNPWLLLAALLVILLTARLGWWQLDRAAQKTAMQRSLDERRALPPLAADALPASGSLEPMLRDRRAQLQGVWQADEVVYLDNRPMAGRTGFYVVMPLRLDDGTAVLVQRGWLPRDLRERTRIAPHRTPAGRTAVAGRIAPALPRLYEFEAAASGPIRQNLELDAFARERRLRLRPWVLIEDESRPPADDGLLRQWPAPASTVHTNYGYAFQWFALCALTLILYVWFQFIRPARRDRADRPA